jgi:hypothetical protein
MSKSYSEIKKRLKYLREEIEAERISTGEIVELQLLAEYIDKGDVILLEWAGVPEHSEHSEKQTKKKQPDSWRDCGNAVYEDRRYSMKKLRRFYHCEQNSFSCSICPVYKEKKTTKVFL